MCEIVTPLELAATLLQLTDFPSDLELGGEETVAEVSVSQRPAPAASPRVQPPTAPNRHSVVVPRGDARARLDLYLLGLVDGIGRSVPKLPMGPVSPSEHHSLLRQQDGVVPSTAHADECGEKRAA